MNRPSYSLPNLALFMTLLSVVLASPSEKLSGPSIDSAYSVEAATHKMTGQLSGNLIYVPVRVNNSAPLWFILDSGVDSFLIDEYRARTLGLKLEGQSNAEGIGENTVHIALVRGVSLSMGDLEFPNRNLIAYPFANLSHTAGHVIDGVLGAGLFKRFVVEIDYATQTVTLFDPKSYEYSGRGDTLPITIEGDVPFAKAKIALPGRDPIEGKFNIDTGGNAALALSSSFVSEHHLLDFVQKTLPATEVGASGQSKGRVGRLKSLQLGRFVIENPITGFSQAKRGTLASTTNSGLIGGLVLRRFKVIFDYSRRRMMLEPNEHSTDPFEYGMTGASITAEGADLKTYTISQVLENSPASESGLRLGDLIVSIDGKLASDFTLDQLSQMFKREGRSYLLTINRGAETLRIQIKLRRLI